MKSFAGSHFYLLQTPTTIGLESLLDIIDALPLLSLDDDDDDDDGIGRMIQKNVEQQLLALDEDDDWSAPASSIDGTLGMMTFEL
jgi:hypothetical protein